MLSFFKSLLSFFRKEQGDFEEKRFYEILDFLKSNGRFKIKKLEKYYVGIVSENNYDAIIELLVQESETQSGNLIEITRGDWLSLFVVSLEDNQYYLLQEVIDSSYDKKITMIKERNSPFDLLKYYKLNLKGFVVYEDGFLFFINKESVVGSMYQPLNKKYLD